MNSRFWRVVCACITVVSFNANAMLVDNGTYTTDTATGFDWLDITETSGMSFVDVSAQFGVGGLFEGWSYATADLISDFFDSAGGVGTYVGADIAHVPLLDTLLPLWGATTNLTTYPGVLFMHEDNAVGGRRYGQLSKNLLLTDYFADIKIGSIPNDATVSSTVGSALVRGVPAVPLPPAVWFFGSGLLGLLGVARRKKT